MAIPFLSDIRLPSAGKVYLWTGHNDNFLKYDLWQASASAGMTIKNIANSGSIILQTNSTTALTLDSSQNVIAADAFTGKLQGAVTGAPDSTIWRVSGQYANWGIFYNEGSPDKIEFKAGGTVTSTIALDNGDITTSGNLDINGTGNSTFAGNAILQGNAGNAQKYLAIYNEGTATHDDALITFKTHGSRQYSFGIDRSTTNLAITTGYASMSAGDVLLEMDSSGNSTFKGDVTINGSHLKLLNHSGAYEGASTDYLYIGGSGLDSSDAAIYLGNAGNDTGYGWRFYYAGSGSGNDNKLIFKSENAGSGVDALSFTQDGNATFAGKINAKGGANVTGFTAGTINAYTATVSSNLYSALRIVDNTAASTYWDIGAVGGASPDLKFFVNASTTPKFTLSTAGNASFAGTITTGSDLTIGGTGGIFIPEYIYHVGDTNTYMGFETSDTWRVVVGGAEALNINTSRIRTNKHIEPSVDSTYNIGTNSVRFANVYADTLHGTVAQANNLQAFDDRDIAPEDLSFSDDLKLFFAEKTGIEGGTVGSDWQDLLILSSYVDSSGGKLNALAFDKSTHRILHYNASHNATNWGTAKELAYKDSVLNLSGGTISGNIAMGDNDITGIDQLIFSSGTYLTDNNTNYLQLNYASGGAGGILILDGDGQTQGYLYADGQATSGFGLLDGSGSWAVRCIEDQYVELRYDNSTKFRTSSTGVNVTGNMAATNDVSGAGDLSIRNINLNQGNSPTITLGVINSSTGNSKVQFYSKNSGAANGYALQYNKDTGIDRLEFIDGSGTANIKFNNGGAAEFAGSVTATQINTGQGATEVHLMNQNVRTSDNVQFADLTLTGNLNLYGDINTQNVTNLDVTDKVITVGKGQAESASGGSGLIVDGSSASILWNETNDTWDFNKGIDVNGNINVDTQSTDILIGDNDFDALEVKQGSNLYMRFNTTNGGEKIEINKPVEATFINASTGFRMASGQAIDFVSTNIGYNSIERNTSVGGLQINTGDTNSMNILDNGNVGLNTTSPEEKLTISTGNVQFRQTAQAANASLGFLGWKNTYATGTHVAAKIDVLTRNESSNAHDYTNLVFSTWNGYNSLSEKMRIADDGNVGIGYNNPYKKLHLHNPTDSGTPDCQMNFTTGVTEASDGNGFRVGWNGTVANMYLFENADMRFATNNSERMRIKADGKVGIGTTSPIYPLHVVGNIYSNAGTIFIDSNRSLMWGNSNQGIKAVNNSSMTFSTGGGARMTLASDGKLGIGTTSPSKQLMLYGNTPFIRLEDSQGGNKRLDLWIDSNAVAHIDANQSASQITFRTASTDRLRITNAGNVGIGDTAPTSISANTFSLSVNSSRSDLTGALINKANGTVKHQQYWDSSGYGFILTASSGDFKWNFGSSEKMRLTETGNVGIGTASPAEKLEVNGSIKLGSMKLQNISAGGRIGFNRNTSNGAIYNSSYEAFQIQSNGSGYLETQAYNSSGAYQGSMVFTDDVKLGIGTTSPTYKLSVPSGGIEAGGKITYSKSAGSLNATGYAVAGITADANGNGSSCGFTFTCFGHTGAYQRVVYSCYNGSGTWYAKKVIDEGTNQLDVVASANGSTITFTFKATSSTMYYTPRVTVEATGQNINSTYA